MKKFNVLSTPLAGTNLIEASAGTGKTFTISMIYLRLLVEQGLRIDQVLVVTFTLPATMELRLRIRKVIAEALRYCETGESGEPIIFGIMKPHTGNPAVVQRLRSALKSFDEASVYTIHSFCQQVLADNAFESGALFSSDIVTDNEAEKRLAADFWRRSVYTLPGEVASYIMKKTSPDELLALYKQRPLSPRLVIEPDAGDHDISSLSAVSQRVQGAYDLFTGSWRAERGDAVRILSDPKLLNQVSYKPEYLAGRIEAIDRYVSCGDPFDVPDKLVFFTSGKILTATKKGCVTPELPLFDMAQKLSDALGGYNTAFSSFLNALKIKMFRFMDEEGKREKGKTGLRGFDDLIKDVEAALESDSGVFFADSVSSRYRAALIDEFQDTDDLQFEIFSRIFMRDRSILFLIGDPKQAIYRFRGADIFSYIKAADMVTNRYTLSSNFRSTPELISSINALFSGHSNPFLFSQIGFAPVDAGRPDQCDYIYRKGKRLPAMDIGLADYSMASSGGDDNDSIILRQLSSEISEITGSGEYSFMPAGRTVRPSDIAVLVRSHAQASAVQGALAAYGIPSVTRGHESVFATEEARELCRVISAVAEPGRSRLVRSAAATSILGYEALTIYMMNEESGEGAAILGELTDRFYACRDTWLMSGFMDMFTLLLHNENITVRILGRDGGERSIANISHLSEILNMVQFENRFSPPELAAWFENSVTEPPSGEEYSVRLDKDSDAVNIITMHACKGLEYPVVYSPYLTHTWQPPGDAVVYHDTSRGNIPVLCLDRDAVTDQQKRIKSDEDLAESIRLMYVALTRAKSMCRVLFMMKRTFRSSAPFYLLLGEHVDGKLKVEDCYAPFMTRLSGLASELNGEINFSVIRGDRGRRYTPDAGEGMSFEQKTFSGEINRTWNMQSYSSITRSSHDEKGDGFAGKTSEEGEGIFAFPRGAKAGLCLHEIFEITDFREGKRESVSTAVQALLRRYGFDDSWTDDITGMFFNVTGAKLPGDDGISLSEIGTTDRLSEMEFNFPLGEFSLSGLREIFSNAPLYGKAVYQRLTGNDAGLRGMMKGFIDLVFRKGDRYYIADWKSNHLGTDSGNYNLSRMEEEMLRHNYHLQYYLYTVALHRYLSMRLGDSYSYSRNFGGVYYFFIRGMTAGDNSPGIFHAMPDGETVVNLDKFFSGEESI